VSAGVTRTRAIAKSLLPPALLGSVQRLTGRSPRFVGPLADWLAARTVSSGYAAPIILERTLAATRAVVAGRAAFERDSVQFAEPAHRFSVVAALMHAAAQARGSLQVIDFGGSLGSTYWQYRQLLAGLDHLRWIVVEQDVIVEAGRREFASDSLEFATTIAAAAARTQAPLALASSVLQYVEDPAAVLNQLGASGATGLLIDRTPMSEEADDRVCVQMVPRRIYHASYPCHVFSRAKLLDRLARDWRLVFELPCDEGSFKSSGGLRFEFRGFYLERRS
jgi:putative methyltransferase (TIGR04325 family)